MFHECPHVLRRLLYALTNYEVPATGGSRALLNIAEVLRLPQVEAREQTARQQHTGQARTGCPRMGIGEDGVLLYTCSLRKHKHAPLGSRVAERSQTSREMNSLQRPAVGPGRTHTRRHN